jgi:hypothetical protein
MESRSGSGSDKRYEQTWWAWPVPDEDDGVLSFVCEWPAYDISETRYEIDAAEIRRAAERARPLWPDLAGPSHITRSEMMRAVRSVSMRSERREAEE